MPSLPLGKRGISTTQREQEKDNVTPTTDETNQERFSGIRQARPENKTPPPTEAGRVRLRKSAARTVEPEGRKPLGKLGILELKRE